ncbi:hypothetical protein BGZ65_012751 [Modicella reniformis]|uniref:Uncharacterized protein n=1 Tax=Modicella reniformis TaxID=1440133 RepID=A0A9P6LSM6_9FUNG|nr:hypothetical protein BGZ65_012751 [Modicella reniformis]
MSDKELLAQIAQVAGAINKHMNNSQPSGHTPYSARGGYNGWGRGRGRGVPAAPVGPFNRKLTLNNNNSNNNRNNAASLPTPPRAQPATSQKPSLPVVKPAIRPPLPSHHLRLINNSTAENTGAIGITTNTAAITSTASPSTSAPPTSTPPTSTPPVSSTTPPVSSTTSIGSGQQWIQSKGKNLSLMNPTSYKKTMQAREKSIRFSKEKKLQLRQARAKLASDLRRGVVTVGGTEYNKSMDGRKLVMRDSSKDNIVINGVLFEMDPRGNKLVRKTTSNITSAPITTTTLSASTVSNGILATPGSGLTGSTPKQLSIDGVVYVRTRSGNLVRASLVRNQLLEKRAVRLAQKQKQKKTLVRKPRAFCKFFTRFVNGGIRVKRSAEEIEKGKREHAGSNSDYMNGKKKRMDDSQLSKRIGRYMNDLQNQNQDQDQDQDMILSGVGKAKRIHYDDNFVPFDFDDEEVNEVMLDQEQDENEVMEDFESDQEVDEEDEEDTSSDAVESEDDEDDVEEMQDIDVYESSEDEDSNNAYGEDDTANEGLNEELQRFYDEQDRQDDGYL